MKTRSAVRKVPVSRVISKIKSKGKAVVSIYDDDSDFPTDVCSLIFYLLIHCIQLLQFIFVPVIPC
jgi:ABC-type tungstate transport system substrate-binding protein